MAAGPGKRSINLIIRRGQGFLRRSTRRAPGLARLAPTWSRRRLGETSLLFQDFLRARTSANLRIGCDGCLS